MLRVFDYAHRPDGAELIRIYTESIDAQVSGKSGDSRQENRNLAEDAFLDYIRYDFYRTKGACCLVWYENGIAVSALRLEPYRDGYLLCGLETAPQDRGRGYAGKLISACVDHLVAKNVTHLYSHVHKRNRISLRLHEKYSFIIISDTGALLDGSVSSMYFTLKRKLTAPSL